MPFLKWKQMHLCDKTMIRSTYMYLSKCSNSLSITQTGNKMFVVFTEHWSEVPQVVKKETSSDPTDVRREKLGPRPNPAAFGVLRLQTDSFRGHFFRVWDTTGKHRVRHSLPINSPLKTIHQQNLAQKRTETSQLESGCFIIDVKKGKEFYESL